MSEWWAFTVTVAVTILFGKLLSWESRRPDIRFDLTTSFER